MTTRDASDDSVEQRLEATWEQLLAHRFAEWAEPQQHPEAVLIVGQPCSGKSVLAEATRRDFAARGGAVSIDVTDLQLLHPAAGVPESRRSREIEEFIVSSAGYTAARMLIAATDRRQHVIAACRVEAEASVAALVDDLHEHEYSVTVVVPVVARAVSWQRAVEAAKASVTSCLPHLDRTRHDRLCDVLVEALSLVEEQELADSICWLDSSGHVLASMTNGVDWSIGTSRRVLAEHAPTSQIDAPAVPAPRDSRNDEHDSRFPQRAHPLEPILAPPQSATTRHTGRQNSSDPDRQLERRRGFLRILELRAESEAKGRG